MIQVNDFKILSDDFTTATTGSTTAEGEAELQRFSINFERQFLYMVRHNPTGLIVTIGRYNQPDANEGSSDHDHGHDHDHDHAHEHEHDHQDS